MYSGAYRCVCVQIKLHHMAVNATAQAGVIEELEGAALHDSSLDPQGSGPAFKVLKQLVSNWLTDAVQNHNRYAPTLAADNVYCSCFIIVMVYCSGVVSGYAHLSISAASQFEP